ncbi:GntR family transcriptional regulator [Rhodovastum atsumiense]|uniref:GntR family transcriptional regulator n=2 Tax=Rhodovastum atsumiense TaxID=504468 RepID=A0A5M6ISX6_9PROT|nr:GntR family transcriptional regulator [Rhodovastum atsumiense]
MIAPRPDPGTARPAFVGELISDQLHRILVERIVTGAMRPGQRVDPGAIAEEFGVSRAPVRDALKRLEFEQLVETKARSGTAVTIPSIADVREVCQLRKGIEWVATGLATPLMSEAQLRELRHEIEAAQKAADRGEYEPFFQSDARLHKSIVAASGNERLIAVQTSFEPYVSWLRVLGATGVHRIAGSTAHHLRIIDAMLARDAVAAQAAAARHLDDVERCTVEDFGEALARCSPRA